MAEHLTFGALRCGGKPKAAFASEGSGKGGEGSLLSEFLGSAAGDNDNNGGGGLISSNGLSGEPAGIARKGDARVKCGEFFADVGKRGIGGDTMHNQMCRGGVQVDCGCARDKVEEGGGLSVKGSRLYGIHGDDGEVVELVELDTLDSDGVEGAIDGVSDRGGGGG